FFVRARVLSAVLRQENSVALEEIVLLVSRDEGARGKLDRCVVDRHLVDLLARKGRFLSAHSRRERELRDVGAAQRNSSEPLEGNRPSTPILGGRFAGATERDRRCVEGTGGRASFAQDVELLSPPRAHRLVEGVELGAGGVILGLVELSTHLGVSDA